MRAIAIAAALLLGSGCAQSPPTPAASARDAPDTELRALTPAEVPAPLPAWTEQVDFSALRNAYGARTDFDQRCEARDVRETASAALLAHRFEEVVERTGPALERCPVWIQLHLWRAAALRSLGRDAEADVHMRWVLGLLDSIMATGDGKTPQTPYVTISTTEEYAVLSRLSLEPRQQSLIANPTMLDVIDAVDESGQTVSVYFNPQWHFIRLLHRVKQ